MLRRRNISQRSRAEGEGTATGEAGEEAKDDQGTDVRGLGARDVPDDEQDIADVVDGVFAVNFREGSDDEGAEAVAQEVDGDDEGGELLVGGVELGHDLLDAGGEDGGCEGAI